MKGIAGRGRETPIQLRAELLQCMDGDVSATPARLSQRRCQWSERDLRRAITIAKRAGLRRFQVEITPQGSISLVVGASPRERRSARR